MSNDNMQPVEAISSADIIDLLKELLVRALSGEIDGLIVGELTRGADDPQMHAAFPVPTPPFIRSRAAALGPNLMYYCTDMEDGATSCIELEEGEGDA